MDALRVGQSSSGIDLRTRQEWCCDRAVFTSGYLTCWVGFLGCSKVAGRLVLGGVVGLGRIRCMKERGMSVRIRRVVVAGVVAAAVAVPAAALASGSGSPSAKPSPAASTPATAAAKSAAAAAKSAAAGSGTRVDPSLTGPAASKSAAAAAKSAAAGSGTRVDRSLTGPTAVAALAGRLGVGTGAARHALQQIGALSGQGGVDPTGPAFAAIARGLGVSSAQLAAALGGVKQALAGK